MADTFYLPPLTPQTCKCGKPATHWQSFKKPRCIRCAERENYVWKLTFWKVIPDFTDPAQRSLLLSQASEALKDSKIKVRRAKTAQKKAEADLATARRAFASASDA